MPSTIQRDFRFRLQPLKSTPDAVLLKYLKSQGRFANDLLLKAIRAFWMPFAYQDCGEKPEQDLRLLAINTVAVLEEHANYLRVSFNLPRTVDVKTIDGEVRNESNSFY